MKSDQIAKMANFPNLLGIRFCIYIYRKVIIITYTYILFNENMLICNYFLHSSLHGLHGMDGGAPFLSIFAMDNIGTQSIADCCRVPIILCKRFSIMELQSDRGEVLLSGAQESQK